MKDDLHGRNVTSAHLLRTLDKEAVETLRIRKTEERTKLECISVLEKHRGKQLGKLLVESALSLVSDRVYIHAQTHCKGFYLRIGFVIEESTVYYESNIPNITMIWPKGQGVLPCTITTL